MAIIVVKTYQAPAGTPRELWQANTPEVLDYIGNFPGRTVHREYNGDTVTVTHTYESQEVHDNFYNDPIFIEANQNWLNHMAEVGIIEI